MLWRCVGEHPIPQPGVLVMVACDDGPYSAALCERCIAKTQGIVSHGLTTRQMRPFIHDRLELI